MIFPEKIILRGNSQGSCCPCAISLPLASSLPSYTLLQWSVVHCSPLFFILFPSIDNLVLILFLQLILSLLHGLTLLVNFLTCHSGTTLFFFSRERVEFIEKLGTSVDQCPFKKGQSLASFIYFFFELWGDKEYLMQVLNRHGVWCSTCWRKQRI